MLKVNFVPLEVKMLSRQRRHRQDSVQTKPLFTLPTRSLQNMQLKSSFNLAAYQNNQLYMWLVFGLDPDSIKLAASFFPPHNTGRMWPDHGNAKHHNDGERAVGSAWCTTFSPIQHIYNKKIFNPDTFVIPAPGLA